MKALNSKPLGLRTKKEIELIFFPGEFFFCILQVPIREFALMRLPSIVHSPLKFRREFRKEPFKRENSKIEWNAIQLQLLQKKKGYEKLFSIKFNLYECLQFLFKNEYIF